MNNHAIEVSAGERFEFGANWSRFLNHLDDTRISEAKLSLQKMLGASSLQGKTFIDVGSGSGLFSLAARILGAKVLSFDYDPASVACTRELKKRFFLDDDNWVIESGSVLDRAYISHLGTFDYVYSWGVLHHTGEMWNAIENVLSLVKLDGSLFIAIYNDQGGASKRWFFLKKLYNHYSILRFPLAVYTLLRQWSITFVKDALSLKPFHSWRTYKAARGMSPWHDIIDWIGGYPFEVAKPEEIFDFLKVRGFELEKMVTCAGGLGCNEFVLSRKSISPRV